MQPVHEGTSSLRKTFIEILRYLAAYQMSLEEQACPSQEATVQRKTGTPRVTERKRIAKTAPEEDVNCLRYLKSQ